MKPQPTTFLSNALEQADDKLIKMVLFEKNWAVRDSRDQRRTSTIIRRDLQKVITKDIFQKNVKEMERPKSESREEGYKTEKDNNHSVEPEEWVNDMWFKAYKHMNSFLTTQAMVTNQLAQSNSYYERVAYWSKGMICLVSDWLVWEDMRAKGEWADWLSCCIVTAGSSKVRCRIDMFAARVCRTIPAAKIDLSEESHDCDCSQIHPSCFHMTAIYTSVY